MGMYFLRWATVIGLCLGGTSGCAVWDWMRTNQPNPPAQQSALKVGSVINLVAPQKMPRNVPHPDTMIVRRNANGIMELVSKDTAQPTAAPVVLAAPIAAAVPVAVAAPVPAPASAPVPQPVVVPLAVAPPVVALTPPSPPATPDDAILVRQSIESWRRAWEAGQATDYLGAYADGFKGDAASAKAWQTQRRQRLANGQISLKFVGMELRLQAEQATASFTQIYRSKRYEDEGSKVLQLRRVNGRWLIESEQFNKTS